MIELAIAAVIIALLAWHQMNKYLNIQLRITEHQIAINSKTDRDPELTEMKQIQSDLANTIEELNSELTAFKLTMSMRNIR